MRYHISSQPVDPKKYPNLIPSVNGPIYTECRILSYVVASTAESELGGLFHNGKKASPLRITLKELGFPQPLTTIKTDNPTDEVIVTATVRKKIHGN